MEDLGAPTSYLVVDKGVPVYSSDEVELGRVVRVLSARAVDMFDGVIFDTTPNRPGGHKFVDAPEVAALYERGVVLKIDAAEAAELPEPSANPGSISISAKDMGGGGGFMDRMRGMFRGRR
jgi:hypothetical protein